MRSLLPGLIVVLGLSASVPCDAAEGSSGSPVRLGRRLPGSGGTTNILGFSSDGRRLLTADEESFAVWDVRSGRKVASIRSGEGKTASRAAFLPDGKTVIASFWKENEILCFNVDSRQVSARIPQPEAVEDLAVAPDGKTLAAYCVGKGVRLWEIVSRKELRRLWPSATPNWGGIGAGLVFSPDGKLIAAPAGDGSIHLLDVASGEEARRLLRKTEVYLVPQIAFSPDGRFLAVHAMELVRSDHYPDSYRSFICLWEVHSGEVLREFRCPDPPQPASNGGEEWMRFYNEIGWGSWGLAFSPDGKTLANTYFRRTQLWEVATGRLRMESSTSRRTPRFSPDGTLLATAGTFSPDARAPMQILLWDWRDPCLKQRESLGIHDLDRLWSELVSDKAAEGYRAIMALRANPKQALALFAARLKRVEPLASDELNRLIANLDDDSFAVREWACKRIADLGEAARPTLLRVRVCSKREYLPIMMYEPQTIPF